MLIQRSVQVLSVLAATVILFAAGCGSGDSDPKLTSTELNFYNWEDFAPPEIVEAFEQEFGVKVNIVTFLNEAEALSGIQSDTSRYDLVTVSDFTVGEMQELRLLAELDHERIPNLENVDAKFLNLPGDPGNRYSAPLDWGTTGILYNKKCLADPVKSWAILGDPDLAGKVAMDIDPQIVMSAALKELGYSENSGDAGELARAGELLKQRVSANGMQFLDMSTDAREKVRSGELCAAQVYNGDAAHDMADDPGIGFFMPREGSDYYVDSLAIPRDAKHKDAAEAFINFVLRPEVQTAFTDYTGYANPNRAAREKGLIDEAVLSDPVRYPDTTGLEAWDVFTGDRRALWNKTWADVQAATTAYSAQ